MASVILSSFCYADSCSSKVAAPDATIMGTKPGDTVGKTESTIRRWFRYKWRQFEVVTPLYVLEPWERALFWIFLLVLFVSLVYAIPLVVQGLLWWFPYPHLPVFGAAVGLPSGQVMILKYLVSGLCLSAVIYGMLHWM